MGRVQIAVNICAVVVIVALSYIVITGAPDETPRDQEESHHIKTVGEFHAIMHAAKLPHSHPLPISKKKPALYH